MGVAAIWSLSNSSCQYLQSEKRENKEAWKIGKSILTFKLSPIVITWCVKYQRQKIFGKFQANVYSTGGKKEESSCRIHGYLDPTNLYGVQIMNRDVDVCVYRQENVSHAGCNFRRRDQITRGCKPFREEGVMFALTNLYDKVNYF